MKIDGFTEYPFKRQKDERKIDDLIKQLLRRIDDGSELRALYSEDIKVEQRDDGEIQVWRLEAYKRR